MGIPMVEGRDFDMRDTAGVHHEGSQLWGSRWWLVRRRVCRRCGLRASIRRRRYATSERGGGTTRLARPRSVGGISAFRHRDILGCKSQNLEAFAGRIELVCSARRCVSPRRILSRPMGWWLVAVRDCMMVQESEMSPNALDCITIQGFKSIASVELELGPINVVIGPNGSGKSNFIGFFAFLHAIREGRLREYVGAAGGAERVLHFGSKTTNEVFVHVSFANKTCQYKLGLRPSGDDGLFPSGEIVYPSDGGEGGEGLAEWQLGREAGISNGRSERFPMAAKCVRHYLGSWRPYHLHDTSASSPMRKTAKVDDNDFLRADGSNLASFLYFLREKHIDSYSLIQRAVQRVTPFFDDFRLQPLRLKPDDIKLEWRHKSSDQYFDASSLSDGTLRFIALTTLFLQPEQFRPSVILVDEPELGLHPGLHPNAIEMLASLIRQASVSTQVIVATQSSLLLDHFAPEDVLVANRVEGGTQLTRLDSGQLAAWLEDYSLGQLWEKNEFGGRPVPD